jgi:hypothetical protein
VRGWTRTEYRIVDAIERGTVSAVVKAELDAVLTAYAQRIAGAAPHVVGPYAEHRGRVSGLGGCLFWIARPLDWCKVDLPGPAFRPAPS